MPVGNGTFRRRRLVKCQFDDVRLGDTVMHFTAGDEFDDKVNTESYRLI